MKKLWGTAFALAIAIPLLAQAQSVGIPTLNPFRVDSNNHIIHQQSNTILRLNNIASSSPVGANGTIFYDTGTNKFRCYQNGAWTDCIAAGSSATTTINGFSGPAFTFATSSATGLNFLITGSGSTITFSPQLATGYVIPLTASTTEWSTAYGWGNHATAGYLTGNQTITLSGDITGSGATSITTSYSGVVPINKGGTGTTTAGSAGTVAYYDGSTLRSTFAGTAGQILQSNGTGAPTFVATSTLFGGLQVTGSGTTSYVARWTGANTIGTGILMDNGTVSGINATSSSYTLNVQGTAGVAPLQIASSTGGSLLVVTQTGNVGIGTTGPGAKFQAVTPKAGTGLLTDISYPTGVWAGIIDNRTNTSGYNGLFVGARSLNASTTLFEAGSWNGDTSIYIPAMKITADSATSIYNLAVPANYSNVFSLTGNYSASFTTAFLGNARDAADNTGVTIGSVRSSDGTILSVNSGVTWSSNLPTGAGTPRFVVMGSGNVGIGTTNPNRPLVVYRSDSPFAQFVDATTGSASTDGLLVGLDNEQQAYVWQYENDNLLFGTNNLERVRIKNDGNIGIGTTTPVAKLSLQGTAGANDIFNVASSSGVSLFQVNRNYTITIGSTTPTATLTVQGFTAYPTAHLFVVASSSNTTFFRVQANGDVLVRDAVRYGEYKLKPMVPALNIGSTTLDSLGKQLSNATSTWFRRYPFAVTLVEMGCRTITAGTANQRVGDGTNFTAGQACTTTWATTTPATNNTWVADELIQIEIGSSASSPNGLETNYVFIPTP